MGFVTRFLNEASQKNKIKINESRLQKFYQVKQLKENSTENSAEKNFKEDSKLNELWNVSTKLKRLKFKELCFPDTLSEKFQQIVPKFATLYLYYPFLSRFVCIKSLLKTLSVLSFRIRIRTRKLQNLLYRLTIWITVNGTLKAPPQKKNITQLNTKLGFSVTHIPIIYIP